MKLQLEAQKEETRLEKEAVEAPEKEALDFYRQLEDEENRKKVEKYKYFFLLQMKLWLKIFKLPENVVFLRFKLNSYEFPGTKSITLNLSILPI